MMFSDLLEQIAPFVQTHGYWVVCIALLLENMGVPLPGELILISGGVLCAEGQLDLRLIAVGAVTGAIVGDNLGYGLGRYMGPRLLTWYQRFFGVSDSKIEGARHLFLRYSGWAVFLGRFVALLRILAGPMAGILGMPWRQFLLYNSAGAILWVTIILGASFFFGQGVKDIFDAVGLWGVIAVAALVAYLKFKLSHSFIK